MDEELLKEVSREERNADADTKTAHGRKKTHREKLARRGVYNPLALLKNADAVILFLWGVACGCLGMHYSVGNYDASCWLCGIIAVFFPFLLTMPRGNMAQTMAYIYDEIFKAWYDRKVKQKNQHPHDNIDRSLLDRLER